MLYDHWNTFLLIAPIGLLCFTNGPQPRFHAFIMLCTGFLGMHLRTVTVDMPGAWSLGFSVYIVLNFITLALSPLQLFLVWFFGPKPEIDHGIVIHHEGDEHGNITVDILAVHGLGSNPAWAWTWEDKGTGKKCMWLKDLLPKSIPRARIMAYNHNSAWFRDAPVKSVRICGEQLLESLNFYRRLPQEVERPIIFIGHSFGGIIIKQALVAAGEKNTDSTYQIIESSMHGVIFLGVPHDGSRLTAWGMLLSYCTYWLGSSTELLEALQSGAGLLRQLNRSFITSYGKLDLVDFFELHKTKAFGMPILLGVDGHSSTNAGVKRIPLETDHIGMNKFRSENQHNYELVLGQLMRMVDRIEKEQTKVFSQEQKESLQSLYLDGSEDRRETIEKSHKSTFQWVDSNPVLRAWLERELQVVWVSGKPGSGKSTLSKHLLDRMAQEQKRHDRINHLQGTAAIIIIGFFFDDRGSEHLSCERGFLQALLYQLVEQVPSLSHIVPQQKTDHTGKKVPLSLSSLRQALLSMLDHPGAKSTRVIVDGFDECAEECKRELLEFVLEDIAKHPSLPQILITSRRQLELEVYLESFPTIKLEDLNGEDIHAYLSSEFGTFTRYHSPKFVERLVKKAEARSQGVFLWVKLVVRELKKGKMLAGTVQELENALDSLPGNLVEFYDRVLDRLDTSANAEERRMLEWVLFAERPLTVTEFRYAVSIGSEPPPSDLASVEETIIPQSLIKARIREYSGGLLEVKRRILPSYSVHHGTNGDLYVQLIHQSVKDFLLEKKSKISEPTSATIPPLIIPSKAHSHLARVCITYLAFPDYDTDDLPLSEALQPPFFQYVTTNWVVHSQLAVRGEETAQMVKFGWPKHHNFRVWLYNYILYRGSDEAPGWENPLFVASQLCLSADVQRFLPFVEQKSYDERITILSGALVTAAIGGHQMAVQMFLERGADANACIEHSGSALQAAASRGHEKVVQLLLDNGADVNAQNGDYGNALQGGAKGGYEKVVQLLLEKGADVNAKGGYFGNALQAAAHEGHEKVVRLLLENGANVNAYGGQFDSALQGAAEGGHERIMRLLLEKGADANHFGEGFSTALQRAAVDGQEKIVQLLLKKGADISAKGGCFGTALQAAARGGHDKIVQLFLERSADINAQGGDYGNALQEAASRGYERVVQLLLENGADVNAQGGHYGNSLHAAMCNDHINVMHLLVEHGADISTLGGKALQKAAQGGCEKLVHLLLVKGVDVNSEGYYGNALNAAASAGHVNVMHLLLKNGADVNAQGEDYGSPLQTAAMRGDEEAVQLLLKNGADINAQNEIYGNALQAAVSERNDKLVQLLLKNGADVNAQGGHLGNALQAVAEGGSEKMVQLLLENGADVNAQGGYYGNALQAAAYENRMNIMQLLLENGANVNAQGGCFGNALQAAALCGHEEVIQLLFENGADVNAQGGQFGNALQGAAQGGHEKAAQLLLRKGADVNTRGGAYGSALQAAAGMANWKIVQLLLRKGADVNTLGERFGNAMAEGGLAKVMQLLDDEPYIHEGEDLT